MIGTLPVGSQDDAFKIFIKNIGTQLKILRKHAGLSQVILAKNIGIDYRHYQNIEGGSVNIRIGTLITILRYHGIQNFDLLIPHKGEMDGVLTSGSDNEEKNRSPRISSAADGELSRGGTPKSFTSGHQTGN